MELLIGVVASLVAVWLLLLVVLWMARPRGVAAGQLLRVIPDTLRLGRSLVADRYVPLAVRLALVGLIIWMVNPFDLVPEFLPVIGPLDDVVVAILVFRFVRRRLGIEQLEARWSGTPEGFATLRRLIG